MKKKQSKFGSLAKQANSFLAKNMLITVILVASFVSVGTAAAFYYSSQASNRKVNTDTVESTEKPGTSETNQTTLPSRNTPVPTLTTTQKPTPVPTLTTTQKPTPVAPEPDKTAICRQLNSDEQAIVDSALQSSYEYYLYQKNAALSDDSYTDEAKENKITHAYTGYQWKVEDWQGDVNRTIKEAGCTSTVVAKLQPR